MYADYKSTVLLLFTFCFVLAPVTAQVQQDGTLDLSSDQLGQGIDLSSTLWRYHAGDDLAWTDPAFNDAGWSLMVSEFDFDSLAEGSWSGIGWFRLHLLVDSTLWYKTLALSIYHIGASEIYLDGKYVGGFGEIGATAEEDQPFSPKGLPLDLYLDGHSEHVLVVRYANRGVTRLSLYEGNLLHPIGFGMVIAPLRVRMHQYIFGSSTSYGGGLIIGILLFMVFLHLVLFFFDKREQANLYFFLFALSGLVALFFAGIFEHATLTSSLAIEWVLPIRDIGLIGIIAFLLATLYTLFYGRLLRLFWILVAFAGAEYLLIFLGWKASATFAVGAGLFLVESVRVIVIALVKKKDGARTIATGLLSMMLGGFIIAFAYVPGEMGRIGVLPESPALTVSFQGVLAVFYLSIPLAMSVLLARRFVQRSRRLEQELVRVEDLSAKSLAQEREKQALIAGQKEHLEVEVAERTAELRQSLSDLKATQAQLIQSEKMASLGSLTAGIAHEIKNPLNFVNNFAEVNEELADEIRDDLAGHPEALSAIEDLLTDLKQNAAVIAKHGKRADSIVKGMMQHAKGSTGEREPTGVNALVEEYFNLAYHGMRAKQSTFNVTMEQHYDEAVGKVEMMPQEMGRVLINLFNNAFYAVHEKAQSINGSYEPVVTVSTRKDGEQVEIRVSDNGPGISTEVTNKIFEPFFTTKPTGSGNTGLGLSLSYDIVTQGHGGRMSVDSVPGEGATFVISLPS